jgi:hypothetical protein
MNKNLSLHHCTLKTATILAFETRTKPQKIGPTVQNNSTIIYNRTSLKKNQTVQTNSTNLNGVDGGLAVCRIEDGFDEEDVDAAVEKAANLLAVRGDHFVER